MAAIEMDETEIRITPYGTRSTVTRNVALMAIDGPPGTPMVYVPLSRAMLTKLYHQITQVLAVEAAVDEKLGVPREQA